MNEVVEVIKSLIPVRLEAAWGAVVGLFGTWTNYMFGEWNNALETLLMLMVLDYASGLLAAYISPRLALNSQKGFKGICRKMYMLIIVAIAHKLDTLLGMFSIKQA